jgi:N6-L-threonylcarbamoyladenine synthase
VIDRLAERGDPLSVPFGEVRTKGELAFSFSGYKTAARVHAERSGLAPLVHPDDPPPQAMLDLVAAFRYAVVRELVRRTRQAIEAERPRALVLAGGVAANSLLRREITGLADAHGLALSIPPPRYCADNAAMILKAGLPRLLAGENDVADLDAAAYLPLGGPETVRTSRRHR